MVEKKKVLNYNSILCYGWKKKSWITIQYFAMVEKCIWMDLSSLLLAKAAHLILNLYKKGHLILI